MRGRRMQFGLRRNCFGSRRREENDSVDGGCVDYFRRGAAGVEIAGNEAAAARRIPAATLGARATPARRRKYFASGDIVVWTALRNELGGRFGGLLLSLECG